jgi:hypothetical protein
LSFSFRAGHEKIVATGELFEKTAVLHALRRLAREIHGDRMSTLPEWAGPISVGFGLTTLTPFRVVSSRAFRLKAVAARNEIIVLF